MVANEMSLTELSLGELRMNRCRRRKVRETVSMSCRNTLLAHLDRRQEYHIVDFRQAGRSDEGAKEPRADHTVVHDREPAHNELARRPDCSPGHHRVLFMRLGKPRIDGAVGQESEKGVARNEDAPDIESARNFATVDLPAPGGPVTIKSEPIAAFSPSLGTCLH